MTQSVPTAPTSEPVNGVSAQAIDCSCRWPVLGMYYGVGFWLVVSSLAYLIASMSFHAPTLFAESAWLSYGRMAPLANNVLLYGVCIPAGWAAVLWIVARLGRTPLVHGVLVMLGGKLWNIGVFAGAIGILLGDSSGFENVEFPAYAGWILFVGAILMGVAGLNTLRARAVTQLHPVQWFAGVSVLWFPWVYLTALIFLQMSPVRGMAQGAVHWWTVAQLQVVLLGAMGMAVFFYFMPLFKRQPLPSRELALFAFLSLIFCGGWVGVPATAPAPAWQSVLSQVMCVCLLLPLLALILNLWTLRSGQGASEGRFVRFGLRAFIIWTGLVVIGSTLGAFKCLSFTLVEPALTQLYLQGFSLMASLGAAYYVMPRVAGRELPFPAFVRAHFWLAAIGLILVVAPFLLGGLRQATALADPSVPFAEVADGILMPIRLASMGQLLLVLGHGLLLVNVAGLMLHLARARLRCFDNTPVEIRSVTEGSA